MCIIIFKPLGATTDQNILDMCSKKNRDGYGITVLRDGQFQTKKSLKYKNVRKWYRRLTEEAGEESLISLMQFRIKTRGAITIKNVQPFHVRNSLVMAHNGTIHHAKPEKDDSDSLFLSKSIFKELPEDFIYNQAIVSLIDKYVGTSRVLLLSSNGQYVIFNKSDGEEKDGVWYSKRLITQKEYPRVTHRNVYCPTINNNTDFANKKIVREYNTGRFISVISATHTRGCTVITKSDVGMQQVCSNCGCYTEYEDTDTILCISCEENMLRNIL